MENTIYIPEKIKVGYQERKDTYTGKLAYVIYYDQKGVLRKEGSWQSWRKQSISPDDFDNIPMSGFVLNKKVGDYVSDWNHRQAYVRVYDPRNFEFEITIENLMYILENTNSIKGKGLDGDFVYGWYGKDLILIPTSSPDYIELKNYSDMILNPEKITSKNIVLGGTYITNKNQSWIYMGRFDYYDYYYHRDIEMKEASKISKVPKRYFFRNSKYFEAISSLSRRIIKCESTEPVSNYAELMDELECDTMYSPIDLSKDEYVPYTEKEFSDILNKKNYYTDMYIEYNNTIHKVTMYGSNRSNINFRVSHGWYDSYGSYRPSGGESLERVLNDDINNGLTIEQMHDKYKFCKLVQYLKNGKVYKR